MTPDSRFQPCVRSGFCCKKRPCQFGEVTSPTNLACRFLEQLPGEGHPRYACGRYDYIIQQPGWEWNPAFGAGCCSPLFNTDRELILLEDRLKG